MSLKLAHISDIHIRTFKRHKEYRIHFENLYESLRQKQPDVIILTGDLTHQKSNISPEWVEVCVDFLKNLSEIAPIHMIPGNHDCLVNNLSRMDSLSPVIKALDISRIIYHKKS